MASEDDDDYDRISDIDMSESEDEQQTTLDKSTAVTTPQTPRTPRPSELKTIPCPFKDCPKTFNRNARLQEHINSHTNTRKFKCPFVPCSKDFLRDSHLKHHIKSAHSDVRDYKCTWKGCDKSFATGTRLRRHEAAHQGREKYRCRGYDGCNETFRKHDTLKKHIALIHEQRLPYPCTEKDWTTGERCTKAFETAEKLRTHQRAKHDETRFTCTECSQNQGTSFTFNHHDAEITNPAPPISFPTYADLQNHISMVHPPTCELCPTSFTTSKELKRHLELVHAVPNTSATASQAASFTCTYPLCGRTFTKKGNLNVHVKTVHEKRRDFVCGQSEISLPSGSENITDAKVYGCGRDFTSKGSLEEHIRTAHLGMDSKRLERQKRKAVKEEPDSDNEMGVRRTRKPRKPRKDKGIKKSSALQALTGIRIPQAQPSQALEMLDSQVFPEDDEYDNDEETANESDDDDNEQRYMSGSVTMFGSQLYHRDMGVQSANHIPFDNQEWDNEVFEMEKMALDPLLLLT